MRKIGYYVLAAMFFLAACDGAWSWGPDAHSMIVAQAVQLLPEEIKPFYEANSRYLTALSSLPDDWRYTHYTEERPNHFIDLDLLSKPPFDDLIIDKSAAESRFGREKLNEAGILPWAIVERYEKLVRAFKDGDTERIVTNSAVLAHYIGDAHVPFHVTKDYDGKTPDQKGVHFRWEENVVKLWLKPESIKPRAPRQTDDILKSAFEWCISSFGYVDAVCDADDKARAAGPGYNWKYFKVFWQETRPIIESRLTGASEAVAGVYVSAWKSAGKPPIKGEPAPILWDK